MTIQDLDSSIIRAMESWPHWWWHIMTGASFLADPHIITLVVAGGLVVAWRQRSLPLAQAFAWTLPAMLINAFVKQFFHRPRPDTLYVSQMPFQSYSFPSGHAFCAALVYGLFAYLAVRHLPAPWSYVTAGAMVLLIILIGLSRVYLGAHFPTDVIGGWLFGLVVLAVIVRLIRP